MTDLPGDRPVALVTGAAGGIGRATCRRLARDGFAVLMTDRDGEALAAAAGEVEGPTATRLADVTDAAAVDALVGAPARLDVLVNNAGIFEVADIEAIDADRFRRMAEVNLVAVHALARAAAARMTAGGRIVNLASRAAFGARRGVHYAASKAGVIGLTKAMALDLAARGITVNAVAPGVIDTPILAGWSPEERAALEKAQPVGRIGTPEDVAHAVAFLAAPQSGFVTGHVLVVDGGRSIGGMNG